MRNKIRKSILIASLLLVIILLSSCSKIKYKANNLYKNEEYNKALFLNKLLIPFNLNDPNVYLQCAVIYEKLENYVKAEVYYTKALEVNKSASVYRIKEKKYIYGNRGNCRKKLNKFDLAIIDAQKVIELDKNFVEGYLYFELLYIEQENYDQAHNVSNLIRTKFPNEFRGHYKLTRTHFFLKNYERVIADCSYIIEKDSNYSLLSAQVRKATPYESLRGFAYYELGKYDLAIIDANKSIELDRNFVGGYNLLYHIYIKLQDYSKALEVSDLICTNFPADLRGNSFRANANYLLKNYKAVISYCNYIIDQDPLDELEVYYLRGITYYKLGNLPKAL
ncbi:MAG: hypothetical protein KAS49_05755, partial [Candidatus Cloacimonetes bacterium]|nr:hypothetical protein [Candidatus Cloacimonadota bacterium]